MMERMGRIWAGLFGPPAMDPDEVEERIEILEAKVEANKIALIQHEQERHRDQEAPPDR